MLQVEEDIDTSIPLLAETGPISIPLKCSTRKAVLSLSAKVSAPQDAHARARSPAILYICSCAANSASQPGALHTVAYVIQEVHVGGSEGVTLGDEGHATFQIVNDGALDVDFAVDLAPDEVGISVGCRIVTVSSIRRAI